MRIVNRQQFLALPPNTIFAKYKPHVFGDVAIKGESWTNDFWYQSLIDPDTGEHGGTAEFCELLERAQAGESFRLDLECESRDGMYDADQLFLVWEPDDVLALIQRLGKCYVVSEGLTSRPRQ